MTRRWELKMSHESESSSSCSEFILFVKRKETQTPRKTFVSNDDVTKVFSLLCAASKVFAFLEVDGNFHQGLLMSSFIIFANSFLTLLCKVFSFVLQDKESKSGTISMTFQVWEKHFRDKEIGVGSFEKKSIFSFCWARTTKEGQKYENKIVLHRMMKLFGFQRNLVRNWNKEVEKSPF